MNIEFFGFRAVESSPAMVTPPGKLMPHGGSVFSTATIAEETGSHLGRLNWLWLLTLALSVRVVFVFLGSNNGTDAWARYLIARSWIDNPRQLPSQVWLPLHFWLLGGALWIWKSELSARLLTALLGALTILPFWGIVRRTFDERTAFWSALVLSLFGFHIAYSVTTSSEGPTIFFLVLGFYGWVRFRLGHGWKWLLPCGVGFIAASLCRYEVWVIIPLLSVYLLDFSHGWSSVWKNYHAWRQAVTFGLVTSAGIISWMIYSFGLWGDPVASAKRNAWTAQYLQPHHSLIHRLIAVPGALVVTLSPLLLGLAIWGILCNRFHAGQAIKRFLGIVALFMFVLQTVNSVTSNLTMARFTLMYSWLLIPYAFEGLCALSNKFLPFESKWFSFETNFVFGCLLSLFLLWQTGTTAGAYYGPRGIAPQLSSVAPTLPLDPELRSLTGWLKMHRAPTDAVVIDQYNFEAVDITRYSGISFSEALLVPSSLDPLPIEKQVVEFIDHRKPRLLVYCPSGVLGRAWALADEEAELPQLNVKLHRRWQGERYRVYEIEFLRRSN